jgi:hypothetical protein
MTLADDPKTPRPDSDAASEEELPPLTFWQMLSSTLAAAVGVQSQANRERDFSRGKASHFILMGIGFTAVFVVVMVMIVQLVLGQLS